MRFDWLRICLTIVIVALASGYHAAISGEWSIHNQVFSNGQLISESQTIIKHEAIYDFLQETSKDQNRISIYFPQRHSYRILDPTRSIQSEVSEDRIARLVADIAVRAKESEPIYRFAANPSFEVSAEDGGAKLRLTSPAWNYDVDVISADSNEQADEYKLFADSFARVNTLWSPLPPNARLDLNRELHDRGLLPKRVNLRLTNEQSFSTHSYLPHIPIELQEKISAVTRQLDEFKIVSINELRFPTANARKVSGKR